jgi:hypothetical protein
MMGMLDGPVAIGHSDLARNSIREVPRETSAQCAQTSSAACVHGTFVAGILRAKRGSAAPAGEVLCPLRYDRGVSVPGDEAVAVLRPLNPNQPIGDLK